MTDLRHSLVHLSDLTPRRGAVRWAATLGLGTLAFGQPSFAKKKKKKCKCNRCPKGCPIVFNQAGGGKICGRSAASPAACTPCASSDECFAIDGDFPHCLTAGTFLGSGETLPLACPGDPPGECRAVIACAM